MPLYTGVEVFPPIGVARAGDSKEHYLASEDPDDEHPRKNFKFRGPDGKIRPSVVTFHAYLYKNGRPVKEAMYPDYNLIWKVRVANTKGAWVRHKGKLHQETFRLRNPTVDPYPEGFVPSDYSHTKTRTKLIIACDGETQAVTGSTRTSLIGKFQGSGSEEEAHHVQLAEIWTDDKGRLLFKAGSGEGKCVRLPQLFDQYPDLVEYFDNDDWYDTMCDGDITVEIVPLTETAKNEIGSATLSSSLRTVVVGAPPKYTSGLYSPVSLYDLIEDIYEKRRRSGLGHGYDCGDVYYDSDIKPIIQCIQLLSWTNQKANEGHGPHKNHVFNHERLSDTRDPNNSDITPEDYKANQDLRQLIFTRIRVPYNPGDPNNQFIRNSQASEYFMPRISGASGDLPEGLADSNHRDRWASLTQLQYDRLKKWATPHLSFKAGLRPIPASWNEAERITDRLTFAALKWSTGAPCYPGIEVNWMADSNDIYLYSPREEDRPLFRYNDSIEPGYLTKGNSLPWQADFYMWPHVRPDQVIPEESWLGAIKETNLTRKLSPSQFTKRASWTDGLLEREDDERVGSSDLVRKWKTLGFVTSAQTDPPIFVEKERKLPRDGSFFILPANVGGAHIVPTAHIRDWKRQMGASWMSQLWHFRHIAERDTFIITHSDDVRKFAAGYDNEHVSAFSDSEGTLLEWEVILDDSPWKYGVTHVIQQKGKNLRWALTKVDQPITLSDSSSEKDGSQHWFLIPESANPYDYCIKLTSGQVSGKYVGINPDNKSLTISDKPKLWNIQTLNGREYQIKPSASNIAIQNENARLFLQGLQETEPQSWQLEPPGGLGPFSIKLAGAGDNLQSTYWNVNVSDSLSGDSGIFLNLSPEGRENQFEFVMYRPAYELTCKSGSIARQIGLRKGTSTVEGFRTNADFTEQDKFDIQWDFTHVNVNVCTITINSLYALDQKGIISCASAPAAGAQRWVVGSTSNEGEYTISTTDDIPLYWTCLESDDPQVEVHLKPRDENWRNQVFKFNPDSRLV